MRADKLWRELADLNLKRQALAQRALLKTYHKAFEEITREIDSFLRQGDLSWKLARMLDLRQRIGRMIDENTGAAIKQVSYQRIAEIDNAALYAQGIFQYAGVPRGMFGVFNPAAVEAAVFSPYQSVQMIRTFPALLLAAERDPQYAGKTAWEIHMMARGAAKGTMEYSLNRTAERLMGRVWQTTQDAIVNGWGYKKTAAALSDVYGKTAVYAAERVARTEIHHAQLVGQRAMADQAREAGAKLRRFWMATLDDRTRDSHAEMNGVRENEDGTGWTMPDGSQVDGPGLSDDPAESINCRCSEGYDIEGLTSVPTRDNPFNE